MTSFSATLTLRDGVTFDATGGSGQTAVLDSDEVLGGGNHGVRPLEMLLMAVGGCAGIVATSLLRRMQQDVAAYQVCTRPVDRRGVCPTRWPARSSGPIGTRWDGAAPTPSTAQPTRAAWLPRVPRGRS